jgi:DMSO/TMAO reductase YedYZ molybdopterin-dependent catalytic subunit
LNYALDPYSGSNGETKVAEKDQGEQGFISRRGIIQVIASSALAACLPACVSKEEKALGYRPRLKHRTPFITPNEEFYLVAVEPTFRPSFNLQTVAQHWSLELAGLEGKIQRIDYAELLGMANRIIPYTFECIGNAVGGSLIGNAEWQVLPLKPLLLRAGLSSEIKSVMFEGLDDFYSSVSIERATDDYAFIALKMNGMPLPGGHGFPARVILPDLYGMKQPRWLRRITLLREAETTSYWERRGWAGEIAVKNFSRLDTVPDVIAAEDRLITGVAFTGARGVSRVEVSLDAGKHWHGCKLETPTRQHVWSLWSYLWRQPTPGPHTIQVRTIDEDGRVQTAQRSRSYPDGASGYHNMSTRVVEKTG